MGLGFGFGLELGLGLGFGLQLLEELALADQHTQAVKQLIKYELTLTLTPT